MKQEETDIGKSIIEELKKEPNEETTVEIRLFDNKTHKAFYKYLTRTELSVIIAMINKMRWQ